MSDILFTVCKSSSYSDSYRNYFSLSEVDNYIIQIISPIALISCLLNIAFFWKIPNSREPPFDVLLFLSVFSIVNISVYIATLIYNIINPINLINIHQVPDDFSSFCLATGTLSFGAKIGIFTYNFVFCMYYTFKIKNPLKGRWMSQWQLGPKKIIKCILYACLSLLSPLLCCICPIRLVWEVLVMNKLIVGLCGLKIGIPTLIAQLAIDFSFIAILIITSIIFLKYLSKLSKFDSQAPIFYKYYLVYTFILSTNFLLQSIGLTVISIDCYVGLQQYSRIALTSMINVLILIIPITVSFIIWFHPQARKNIYTTIYQTFKKKQKSSVRESYYDDLSLQNNQQTTKDPILIELQELNRFGNGLISGMKERNRVSLLSTILGCITLEARELRQYGEMLNRSSKGSFQDDHIFSWNMKDRYEIVINDLLVRSETECFVQHIPSADFKFVSYAASVFQYLMTIDGIHNLSQSANPTTNLNSIYNNAQGDGGSSGQFFFFTSDNHFILKTVTKKQLQVLLDRIQSYFYHFKTNGDSLIVKIYGLFSTFNPQTQEQIHFMLMGNLCRDIPRKFVNRVYDLKGSTHNRQVFKAEQLAIMKDEQLSKKTLKDVDFDILQKKIKVNLKISEKIKQTLKSDSQFFEENGLIDYSLIVIKIDYQAYAKSVQNNQLCYDERTMFESSQNKDFIYIFGIIDYLETWNVKKKGEKWYKSIWNKSESISSQSPTFYAERFNKNLIQKIFQ